MSSFHVSPVSVAETTDELSVLSKRPAHDVNNDSQDASATAHPNKIPNMTPLPPPCLTSQVSTIIPKAADSNVRSFSGVSLRGYRPSTKWKENQDRLIMFEDPATNSVIIGCLDGHGVHGHTIAERVSQELAQRLPRHEHFGSLVEVAVTEVLRDIEDGIRSGQDARMAEFSGTTLALIIIRGRRVLVANIGDSRVLLGKRSYCNQQAMLSAQQLSIDHKPDVASELDRVRASGGRVFSVRYENGMVGPPRVWLKAVNVPGLAMSRSIGDFVVQAVGVISTPEFTSYELDLEEDFSLIVATDGLWDVFSNHEIVSAVHFYTDPQEALLAMLQEAQRRWLLREPAVDDTTICVVHLQQTSAGARSASDESASTMASADSLGDLSTSASTLNNSTASITPSSASAPAAHHI